MSDYPSIWVAIKFNKMEQFTKARQPNVSMWVHGFYDAYAKALSKKSKEIVWKIVDEVEVRGKMVQCHVNEINVVLCTLDN